MKSHILELSILPWIIGFLWNFLLACDANSVHKGAVIWLLNLYYKEVGIRSTQYEAASKRKAESRMPSTRQLQ